MPAIWNLRKWLEEQGITSASEVRRIVRERTGYVLSKQAVCDLLNNQPKMVRIETSQALCDAFYCCLSEFFEVKPGAAFRTHRQAPHAPYPLRQSEEQSVGAGTMNSRPAELSDDEPRVDFAAFFPDARQYSLKLSEESVQSRTPERSSDSPTKRPKVKKCHTQ